MSATQELVENAERSYLGRTMETFFGQGGVEKK